MFNCQKDPLVELFKKKGYNLISVPKDDIQPFQLLTKSKTGFIEWFSFQKEVDEAGVSLDFMLDAEKIDTKYLPKIKKNRNIAGFQGATSRSLSLTARIELFCNLCDINDMLPPEQKIALKTVFSAAERLSFKVAGEPKEDYISVEKLKSHIARATLNENFKARFEETEYYIITTVLKCKSFEMKASDNNGKDISLDIKTLQTIAKVDTNIALKLMKDNSSLVSVERNKALTVAFKAVRLFYDKKANKLSIKNKLGLKMRGNEEGNINNSPYEYFMTEQAFVKL